MKKFRKLLLVHEFHRVEILSYDCDVEDVAGIADRSCRYAEHIIEHVRRPSDARNSRESPRFRPYMPVLCMSIRCQ